MSNELRMLLAIVLSFLVFFLYQLIFADKKQVHKVEPDQQAAVAEKEVPPVGEDVKVLEEAPPVAEAPSLPQGAVVPGRTITVSTGLYVAELVEGPGAFQAFRLKRYKENLAADSPMKELLGLPAGKGATPFVSFEGGAVQGIDQADFRAEGQETVIDASGGSRDLRFTWTSPEGITVIKTYAFTPGTYTVGLVVQVRNPASRSLEDRLTVSLRNMVEAKKGSGYTFTGPAVLVNGELKEIAVKDLEDEAKQSGVVSWAAFETQYFATGLIPEKAENTVVRLSQRSNDLLETTYVDPAPAVAPQTERTYRYTLYFGPKSQEGLHAAGGDFARILDFGWFDIIAKPFLWVMNTIYGVIPNYGIAIILITIVVKLLFWPLSNKSYQSMSQMKRLQPKMAEIREKYKNDKKMMNQELMNLYKLYKVNPLGGCLPMVLQIPVFFAFYKMLLQAIELRHAPFFLWINDLSAPDRLFDFGVSIPLMAPPYGIPVLTLIMGASMFLQQKMSPPPGDPAQAKMMMFMPIFFTFIFINFPSGLVLYWLVNNILSIGQQYFVTKKTA